MTIQDQPIAFLLIRDVSDSASNVPEIQADVQEICTQVVAKQISSQSSFSLIKYADHFDSANQWSPQSEIRKDPKLCLNSEFKRNTRGTNPSKAVSRAQELLDRPEVSGLSLFIVITMHSDEPEVDGQLDRSELIEHLNRLADQVASRKGSILILSGTANQLKSDLVEKLKNPVFIHSTRLKDAAKFMDQLKAAQKK